VLLKILANQNSKGLLSQMLALSTSVMWYMQDHQTCYEACRTASSSLRDMQQALQAVRMAARCLYLRLLLSDAAKTEFAAHAPAVAGFFSGDHEQLLAVPA